MRSDLKAFCNGVEEYFYDNDSRMYNDESYGVKLARVIICMRAAMVIGTCDDGRDEYNCTPNQLFLHRKIPMYISYQLYNDLFAC